MHLVSKLANSANITNLPQNFLKIILIWMSNNAKFDADFESVENVVKKFLGKRL